MNNIKIKIQAHGLQHVAVENNNTKDLLSNRLRTECVHFFVWMTHLIQIYYLTKYNIIKIILHRIISVVNLDEFPTRNVDSNPSRWRGTKQASEREVLGQRKPTEQLPSPTIEMAVLVNSSGCSRGGLRVVNYAKNFKSFHKKKTVHNNLFNALPKCWLLNSRSTFYDLRHFNLVKLSLNCDSRRINTTKEIFIRTVV